MTLKEILLGDFITLKRGYDLPNNDRKAGAIPVVSSSGVTGTHAEAKVRGPGVVTGRYGTLGEVFYVEEDFWPLNTALYVQDFKGNNPRFVSYFLRKELMGLLSDKAAVPGVNRNDLHARKVHAVLDHAAQREIAEFLARYDDLISNNTRRIELLERSARLLFEEWFGRLRYPGHEHDKIIDGVPEGWKREKVKAHLGKLPATKKIKKEDFLPVGDIPCVDQSREFINGYTNDLEALIDLPLPIVVFGDHTRILKYVDFPFARGADGTQLIHPKSDELSVEYLYYALTAADLSNYFYARHFKFLKELEILVPARALVRKFSVFAGDTFKLASRLRETSRRLAFARDLLLPRLMDGRIEV